MDRLFRNNGVEVAIWKWNLSHVGSRKCYAVGDTFTPRIFERGVGMVARQVFGTPNISMPAAVPVVIQCQNQIRERVLSFVVAHAGSA